MRLDDGQIEVMDDATAEMLRAKTGAERIAMADAFFRFARDGIRIRLREEHPDWDDARVNAEVARRLSHGAV
ncbi:MAG: hypothetical protein HOP29_12295 [Phycisphaerales bacterium]|nr:hypothetical protein [Phycisphaerales bacterium]